MLTAVNASISTPVAAVMRAEAVMTTRSRAAGMAKSTAQWVMGNGWQRGMSVAGFLAAMMPAMRAVAKTFPLAMPSLLDGGDGGRSASEFRRAPPPARHKGGLGGDIHHLGLARGHRDGKIFSFLAVRADDALFPFNHRGAHLFREMPMLFDMPGHEPGEVPSKSVVTRISPSQSDPDPMPMVGMGICAVISRATGGVTNSSTMANAPASASALASAIKLERSSRSFAFDAVAAFDHRRFAGACPSGPRNGMPAAMMARTWGRMFRPPSALTASAPAATRRRVFSSAAATVRQLLKGRSAASKARGLARAAART